MENAKNEKDTNFTIVLYNTAFKSRLYECSLSYRHSGKKFANLSDDLVWTFNTTMPGIIVTNSSFNTTEGFSDLRKITFDLSGLGDPLPVELTSFTASISEGNVNLNWITATEVNNYGFEIERTSFINGEATSNKTWNSIGFIEGHGNSNSPKVYNYQDNLSGITSDLSNKTLEYRLKQIDTDGSYEYFNILAAVDANTLADNLGDVMPTSFELNQNYPNPFNPSTKISYSLAQDGFVTMRVFNVIGKEVKTLVNENKKAGNYTENFDGNNLASGIYFLRLTAGMNKRNIKMLLIK